MKLGMGLLNVASVANSRKNPLNPWFAGMADPTGGCLVTMVRRRTGSPPLSVAIILSESRL